MSSKREALCAVPDALELHRPSKTVATVVCLLILSIPSVWLIVTVPPLWRDVDAYVQTVYPLNVNTILLHAPLYCILSRVPLWLGYLISGAGPAVSLGHFIKHTQLTDSGVLALVIAQHVALWFAALFLICTITATVWLRLLLAIFFASHPLFYAFAQCVGSETLSMIVTVSMVATGLRVVLRYPNVGLRDWILFGVSLCAAILTRHISSVLAALLPMTILLIALVPVLNKSFACSQAASTVNFKVGRQTRIWCASVMTGLSALILATSFTHLLCWRANIPWRSKYGFAFIWRLNFLDRVPLGSRDNFLSMAASKCQLAQTRQLFLRLAELLRQNQFVEPTSFIKESRGFFLSGDGKFQDEKFDRSLNEMAYALLCPPSAALRSAALQDFQYATRLNEKDVVNYLFVTTDYFFDHRALMPQCASLKTFHEGPTQLAAAVNQSYFRSWDPISFRLWTIIWLLLLFMAIAINAKFQTNGSRVILYAVVLSVFGIGIVLLNCFFAAIQPRFALPMMEFLIVSIMILLGVILGGVQILASPVKAERM